MIIKEPPEVIYTGIKRTLGAPSDYNINAAQNNFNNTFDLKIPINETDQKKLVNAGLHH